MTSYLASVPRKTLYLILLLALVKIGLHLYTNLFAGYGIFRDELYYLACANHPAWGYVDHPPLSVWVLKVHTWLFDTSVFAIRLVPAFCSGLALFFFGLTTHALGGRRLAVTLVCTALTVSVIFLAYCTYYSMNSIDLLLWSIALFLLIRLIQTGTPTTPTLWLWLGGFLGLALLNKIGALFLGTGIFVALLCMPARRWFLTPWPYYCAAISLLLFSPYVLWNVQHDMAHLEFIHNASTIKYAAMSPKTFWVGQFILNNPVTLPLALLGIVYLFYCRPFSGYYFLFIIFCVVSIIFTLNGTSKPEYLASIYPVLFMGGALLIEQWATTRRWLAYISVAVILFGIPLIPFAIPILPVDTYIAYAQAMGEKPESIEGKKLHELPQFYADMFGWEEKAAAVARAYHALTPEEQNVCTIFNDNYGRAGAIDYYAQKYNIPHSIGKHNNYWLWGPGDPPPEIMLILSDEVGDKTKYFESVEDMGTVTCTYCLPYENNLHVYCCRGLKGDIKTIWPSLKEYI